MKSIEIFIKSLTRRACVSLKLYKWCEVNPIEGTLLRCLASFWREGDFSSLTRSEGEWGFFSSHLMKQFIPHFIKFTKEFIGISMKSFHLINEAVHGIFHEVLIKLMNVSTGGNPTNKFMVISWKKP